MALGNSAGYVKLTMTNLSTQLESDSFSTFIQNQRLFEKDAIQRTEKALANLLIHFPQIEKQIIQLHEALLFSMAYPASNKVYDLANQVMQLLVQTVKNKVAKDENAFYNSGITGSLICGQFGLLLNQYLLQEDLKTIELSGVDGENSDLVAKLTYTLSDVEQELMPGDAGYFSKWQKRYLPGIKDSQKQLDYYIQACMQMTGSISYRENLFAGFQLFTQFSLDEKLLGLSLGRLNQSSVYIHDKGIQKKSTLEEVWELGKPKQIKLSLEQQAHLVRLARGSMASLMRETDTFTYAQIPETELFDMGKGISIALFYMIPEQKFSLQSYVGYLLFKNGLPMAYGGCWLLGFQAAFGVNVLPPYRGGESNLVIAQLIRLYRSRFQIQQFTVDTYQIGKGNSDGIKSGAFWFYYKLRFRPMNDKLAKLAELEMEKMITEKGYRTPAKTLVKLADADIYWQAEGNTKSFIPLLPISDKISNHVAKNFNGNRLLALNSAQIKFKKFTKRKLGSDSFLNRLLVMLDALGAFEKLSEKELVQVLDAYQLKGEQEAKVHLLLLKVKSYWKLFV
ncbi:MAG: hypothetical protein K9H61_08845 [Bacteroidia bacterium]|nr:hypothetical protein [Bacteroidia bacterium]MCF8427430.1 hypothetical protein [Bacteroidia bacterium]MCF8447087.1 hypothetical protein [Bacteroidia bacterium]